MSDNFRVDVFYKLVGDDQEHKVRWMNIHPAAAVAKTKRKYPRGIDFRTVTYHPDTIKKYIPDPPEGWEFARFKVKMKKNRFGVLVNDRAEEIEI